MRYKNDKNIKFVITRFDFFKLKMHPRPRGRWGSLQCSPRPRSRLGRGILTSHSPPCAELGAYGASVLRPPSTQNPGYTSVLILEWVRPPGTSAIDIIAMTSSGQVTSSVTSLIDSARQLSYRLPIVTDLLSSAVSEIVSLKNGHTHNVCRVTLTERDTGTHSAYAWGYDTVNY